VSLRGLAWANEAGFWEGQKKRGYLSPAGSACWGRWRASEPSAAALVPGRPRRNFAAS
jgi:hypothetical protein